MTIERRTFRTEFRTDSRATGKGRRRWATAVTYGTVDDYGTTWRPHVFDDALGERMPVILYGHDAFSLEHVLGVGVDFRQTPASVGPPGVDVLIEFADPEKVPASGLAMHLIDTKVLRDVSVGFERRQWLTRDQLPEADLKAGASEAMVRAGMDELSIVVRGAVPGAQMRSRPTTPASDLDRALDDALRGLRARGVLPSDLIAPPAPQRRSSPDLAALDADLDATLRRIGRR